MARVESSPDRLWPLLSGTAGAEVVVVDRLSAPWEAQSLHRHSTPTLVIPLLGSVGLEVAAGEVLPLPPGRLALIATWTWHRHPRPLGEGVALILGRCGALVDFELRGAGGSWWGEAAADALAGPWDALAAAGDDGSRLTAARALLAALAATAPQPAPGGGPLHRLCAFAWLHRTRPVSAAQVLAASGLSYAQAHRLFVRRFGETPKRYLLRCRIDLAKRLLAAGQAPGAIWADCGFSSRADLTRRMRLASGSPPRAWRAR